MTRRIRPAQGLGPAILPLLLTFLIGGVPAAAQTPADTVKALELKRFQAMTANDLPALGALLADDLIYTHSSGVADNKAAYLEALRSGKTRYVSIAPETTNVRIFGDTAIINGRIKAMVESGGQKNDLNLSYLCAWVRRGGTWQMVAWQSARIPPAQ